MDDWRKALDNGNIVGSVMIDLSKALDSVNHTILLTKLEAYGVGGTELSSSWLRDYLTGRKQRVVFRGTTCSWTSIKRGVPQGSVLGPLLFSVFVNDLLAAIKQSSVNLYADDTTIFYSANDPADVSRVLEADLNSVQTWIDDNLSMNIGKTQLMVLCRKGTRNLLREYLLYMYIVEIK